MMKIKRIHIILSVAAFLLLIPLIAMQFTEEVNWSLFDFVVASLLLIGTGLSIEFILRKAKTIQAKFILVAISLFILIIIWAELAVGLFGSPFAGN